MHYIEVPVGEWTVLDEDEAMALTGAGGPERIPTEMGTFHVSEEIEGTEVMVEVSDEGWIVLARLNSDDDIEVFIIPHS